MSAPPAEAPVPVAAPVPLRRNRDFLLLWTGAGFASLGLHLTLVLYPMLVVWRGGSATSAGIVTAAAVLPHLLVQLPAGALVDRFDRRRLMIASDLGCLIISASVLVAVAVDAIAIGHLMIAAFVHGSFGIVYELAERTAARHLVHETQVATALSQNEARKRAVGMLGDPIGSLLFSLLRWTPFLLTVVAHLISLTELLLIRKNFQSTRAEARTTSLYAEVAIGVRWLWQQRFLRAAMLLIAGSNLIFAGIILTLIIIVHDSATSPAAVGLILAVGGMGGVLGALTGMRWRRLLSMRAILPVSLLAWGLSILPLSFVVNPVGLAAVFACCGYVGGALTTIGYVYAVQVTPDEVLGRAMSVMMLLGSGANFIGAFAIGFALDASPVHRVVVMMSAAMAGLAVIAFVHPAVRGVTAPNGERLTDPPVPS
jgi:MFS family permease